MEAAAATTQPEDRIKELIDQLRESPDFIHLPWPKDWYKKYNIPFTPPQNMKQFMEENHWYTRHFDPNVERVIITEVSGIVKPVPEPEVIPVEIITKHAETQTDEDNQQTTTPKSAHSTESSEKAHLD